MGKNIFDTVIIGASFAGRNAALTLARVRRTIIMIDGQSPRNEDVHHFHNYLGEDGLAPTKLWQRSDKELLKYPNFNTVKDIVTDISRAKDDCFTITTENGPSYVARSIILATGVTDKLPHIHGLQSCWGISAWHCPYCHGYEAADKPIAICACNAEDAYHMANIACRLSNEIHIVGASGLQFSADQKNDLHLLKVIFHDAAPKTLHHAGGFINKLELCDDSTFTCGAFYVKSELSVELKYAKELGLNYNEHNLLNCDNKGLTDVEGIYAAGDIAEPIHQAIVAAASGLQTAIAANGWLMKKDLEQKRAEQLSGPLHI